MKKLIIAILLVVCAQFVEAQQALKNTITYEGQEYFINGMNVPWHHFGGDVGNHVLWGSLYDSTWFDNHFKECKEYGANVVRLWIHCDGRANPEFDADGMPTGLDTDFFIDLDDCFRRAKKYDIMIMPCMWSFDMCKRNLDAGPTAGSHHDLFLEDAKMEAYISKVWTPIVKRYANQCNLFAWEVCNEPEWALDRKFMNDTNWTYRSDYVVPVEKMQKLTGWMASVVHEHSNKMVTTGSASIRWNSDVAPAVGNWWGDEALGKATDGMKGAFLDFYQVHYYDYMVPMGGDLYDLERPVSSWNIDRPIIIGETPSDTASAKVYTVDEQMDNAYKNGFAGMMYWSYNAQDGIGAFDDFKNTLKRFNEEHPKLVNPKKCSCHFIKDETLNFNTAIKGKKINVSWTAEDPLILKSFTVEVSSDGKTFKGAKKVASLSFTDVNYKSKIKNKGNITHIRIVENDVYGWKRTSSSFLLK